MLRYKTDRTWFTCLLRRSARKRIGSILTTPEPARGCWCKIFYRPDAFLVTQPTVSGSEGIPTTYL